VNTVFFANIQGGFMNSKRNAALNATIQRVHPEIAILVESRDETVPLGYRELITSPVSPMRLRKDPRNCDKIAILGRNDFEIDCSGTISLNKDDMFANYLVFGRYLVIGVHLYPYDSRIRIQELSVLGDFLSRYRDRHIILGGDWKIALSYSPIASKLARKSPRIQDCISKEQKECLLKMAQINKLCIHNHGYSFPVGPIRKGWEFRILSYLPPWACLDFVLHSYSLPSRGRLIDGSPWSDHHALATSFLP
jgi:hypothetical protein